MNQLYYANQQIESKALFYDQISNQIPYRDLKKRAILPSKMFIIKEELKHFASANPTKAIYNASQGDGGLSLGGIPPKDLAAALIRYLPSHGSTKYGDPIGRIDIREAIMQNYYGFDSLTADNIIVGDGGRDLLQKWYQLLQYSNQNTGGSLIVSAAPWGSYMQGTYLNGLNTLLAPGSANQGFRITPEGIDTCIALGQQSNKPVVGLVITSPDNPTGNYIAMNEIKSLIQHAVSRGIRYILLDFMYQAVTDPGISLYDCNGLINSLSPEERNTIFILDGLTKSVGGSNLRNCHLVFGNKEHMTPLKGLSTHSVLPNALGEAAALEVYGRPDPTSHPWMQKVVQATAQSRSIMKQELTKHGFRFIIGQGYYAFINIWPWLGKRLPDNLAFTDKITGRTIDNISSVHDLKSYMTQKWGLAIVPGSFFHQPHFIRFSYANAPDYTKGSIDRFHEGLSALI